MSSNPSAPITTLHIVYVHGWYGDHTSFQAFPTDLHNHLLLKLGSENITLNTHIYPTYKAKRPINEATEKLLTWLHTLPEGHIILAGHSLGGYLTADASMLSRKFPALKGRVVGMIAFDTPYLGIHPHVVISGLASILPAHGPKEADVNDPTKVNMPSPQSSVYTTGSPLVALPPVPAPSFREKAQKFFAKHGNDPLGYTAKWITEFFEFGSSVIDKQSLSARYLALEKWGDMGDQAGLASAANNPDIGGDWIHFFTVAMKRERDESGQLINESPGHSPPPSIFYPDRQGSSGNAPAMVGEIPVEIAPFKPKDQPSSVDPSLSTTTTTASIPSPASTTTSPADAEPPAYAPSDSASGSGLEFEQFKKSARDEKALFHARRAEKAARRAAAAESSSSHGGFSLSRMLGRKKSDLGSNQPAPPAVQQPAAPAGDSDLLSPTSINPEGGPTMNPRASLSNTSLSSFASRESSLDVPAPGGSLSRPTSPTGSTHSGAPSSQGRRKKQGRPHHFIVLPWAMPYRWKGIYIEGVDDEVAAHTGIFFPNMNFEYDSLVEKAGNFVMEAVRKRQVAFGIQPA